MILWFEPTKVCVSLQITTFIGLGVIWLSIHPSIILTSAALLVGVVQKKWEEEKIIGVQWIFILSMSSHLVDFGLDFISLLVHGV